jgi:hypothetical protein
MSEKQEKKIASRTTVIALGVICIILAVSLVGAIADYTSIVSGKDNTIANLNDIVNLANSTVWTSNDIMNQSASSYSHWVVGRSSYTFMDPAFSACYPRYISVWVQTSTTANTYVRVIWSAYGISYDNTTIVGTSGTAVFPVLPCLTVEIRVGNTNLVDNATETVTITYYY